MVLEVSNDISAAHLGEQFRISPSPRPDFQHHIVSGQERSEQALIDVIDDLVGWDTSAN